MIKGQIEWVVSVKKKRRRPGQLPGRDRIEPVKSGIRIGESVFEDLEPSLKNITDPKHWKIHTVFIYVSWSSFPYCYFGYLHHLRRITKYDQEIAGGLTCKLLISLMLPILSIVIWSSLTKSNISLEVQHQLWLCCLYDASKHSRTFRILLTVWHFICMVTYRQWTSKVGTRSFFLSPLPPVRYLEIVHPLRAGQLFSKIC